MSLLRLSLPLALLFASSSALAADDAPPTSKPNIIFIMADDK